MSVRKTLGGERLGGENEMKVNLHNFGRSSHNISKIFKTDQAVGTLVPCFCDIATNGTTYYIDLATKVRTAPTNGPIFGRFKHQIDVFHAPIRLYIAALHNNALGVGLKMANIKLPMIETTVPSIKFGAKNNLINQQQISQDSLLAYLGIRGLGAPGNTQGAGIGFTRKLPAIFLLFYWDVYKNYYANKQEEVGYVITKAGSAGWVSAEIYEKNGTVATQTTSEDNVWDNSVEIKAGMLLQITYEDIVPKEVAMDTRIAITEGLTKLRDLNVSYRQNNRIWEIRFLEDLGQSTDTDEAAIITENYGIALTKFELANIDQMREDILKAPKTTPFIISTNSAVPYSSCIKKYTQQTGRIAIAADGTQVGLGVKTYLSDRFNNWLSTEWIDGTNGINEITAIDVSDGKLNINELILQKKIFDMLNRIAVSGGSYNDWQEAVYGEKTIRMAESPIYAGGLSSEITFAEVVSSSDAVNAEGEAQPLGSLAGRGVDHDTRGGRSIKIKIKEPSMVMIIESITPRIDYSQGNKWWNNLETMDDLHKPSLDAIGFQELPTEEICAWDSVVTGTGVNYKSAGKQPSWIEYMTNTDEAFGSFSAGESLDFMAMNREYTAGQTGSIKDLTTYIDPTIWNKPFAVRDLTAKNFWVQIAINCTARRKMSAKQIPNL